MGLWLYKRDSRLIPCLFHLVAQTVKHLPTMWEIQVQSLVRKDHLEKEMATHSSTLAWKIPWTEEPGGLQTMGLQESNTTERLHFHFSLSTMWGYNEKVIHEPGRNSLCRRHRIRMPWSSTFQSPELRNEFLLFIRHPFLLW